MSRIVGTISPINYSYLPFDESKQIEENLPNVLGVLKGDHFVPNGESRNERFYGADLWETVQGNVRIQERMGNGQMFGTIGHDLEITEEALREGKVSHYTKNMQLVRRGGEIQGYAESYVLDTPVGRVLHAYLSGGSKMFVSSRADGSFKPGAKHYSEKLGKHIPVVDPKKYKLERFDVVPQPGFLKAQPEFQNVRENLNSEDVALFESLVAQSENEGLANNDFELAEQQAYLFEQKKPKKRGEDTPTIPSRYDDSLDLDQNSKATVALPDVKEEKMSEEYKNLFNEARDESKLQSKKIVELEKTNESLKTLNQSKQDDLSESASALQEEKDRASNIQEKLQEFETIGTVEEFKSFKEDIGPSPSEATIALTEALEKIECNNRFFEKLGSMKEIEEALEEQDKELKEWREIAETPEACATSIKEAMGKLQKVQEDTQAVQLKELSEEFGMEEDTIKSIQENGVPFGKLRETIEAVHGKRPSANGDLMSRMQENGTPKAPYTNDGEKAEFLSERLYGGSGSSVRSVVSGRAFVEGKGRLTGSVQKDDK